MGEPCRFPRVKVRHSHVRIAVYCSSRRHPFKCTCIISTMIHIRVGAPLRHPRRKQLTATRPTTTISRWASITLKRCHRYRVQSQPQLIRVITIHQRLNPTNQAHRKAFKAAAVLNHHSPTLKIHHRPVQHRQ